MSQIIDQMYHVIMCFALKIVMKKQKVENMVKQKAKVFIISTSFVFAFKNKSFAFTNYYFKAKVYRDILL